MMSVEKKRDYVIHPLTTQGDDGQPSHSLQKDLHRVLAFIRDEKVLLAYSLYLDIKERVGLYEAERKNIDSEDLAVEESGRGILTSIKHRRQKKQRKEDEELQRMENERDFNKTIELMEQKHTILQNLVHRAKLFLKTKNDIESNSDWIFVQKFLGITTYYKREDDDSLSVKLEGHMADVPLFEQVAVLREVDLHCKWVPFCTSSRTVKELNTLDVVGWFVTGLPMFGIMRDGCFRAISCDNLEDGKILLAGHGIADNDNSNANNSNKKNNTATEDNVESSMTLEEKFFSNDPTILQSLDIPPIPTKMGSGRMTIRRFDAVIDVKSPTNVQTHVVANVNPNLTFLPQSLIEFVMKKLCGLVLCKLQGAAQKIIDNPVSNVHARRIRDDLSFYKEWLLPKFQYHCSENGWSMPTIPALELTEEQMRYDESLREREYQKEKRKASKKIKHSVSFAVGDVNNGSGRSNDHHERNRMHSCDDVLILNQENSYSFDGDDSIGTDAISELSTTTSFAGGSAMSKRWLSKKKKRKGGPMMRMLREIERKEQLKKEKKISEARQKASARLSAKPFSPSDTNRINELKETIKQRQNIMNTSTHSSQNSQQEEEPSAVDGSIEEAGPRNITAAASTSSIVYDRSIGCTTTDKGVQENMSSPNQILAIQAIGRSHESSNLRGSIRMQFFVPATLTLMMFAVLSLGVFVDPIFCPVRNESWLLIALRDIGTISYLFICALIHFLLIDIELKRAFLSLEIGMKSGKLTKNYYNNTKRALVAIMSFGIVTMCISRAIVLSWFKIGTDLAFGMYQYLFRGGQEVIHLITSVVQSRIITLKTFMPQFVISCMETALLWIIKVFDMLNSFIVSVVRSNYIGRTIESTILSCQVFLSKIVTDAPIVDRNVSVYEEESIALSWRSNAITSSRLFLSYSALFFVTILILLRISKKKEGPRDQNVEKSKSASLKGNEQQNGYVPVPLTTNGVISLVSYEQNDFGSTASSSLRRRKRFGHRIKKFRARRGDDDDSRGGGIRNA